MGKDALVGSIVIGIIVVGIIGYAALKPIPAQSPSETGTVNLPVEGYTEHAEYYDIQADYATSTPLLASAGAGADAAAVALMQSFVRDTIAQFKKDGDFENLTPEDIAVLGLDQGRKESLKIVYLIAPAPRTLSYIFTIYMDTLGAHGNTFFHTFTFDRATGAPLTLSDLFTPGSEYLAMLSEKSRAKLSGVIGDFADTRMIENGTEPEEANFSNFFFEKTDLVLLFPPYQVAAYAAGPQTLRIPLSELSTILRPQYR